MIENNDPFTVSELVLLNGCDFAPKVGWPSTSVTLFDGETKVAAAKLGRKMLAAAFLTIEAHQGLRLVEDQKKLLFGLFKPTTLYAELGPETPSFPTPSLETFILRRVSQGREEVSTILYDWLGQDTSQPWVTAADLVKDNLVQRGLVNEVKEKRLKIFTIKNYILPPKTTGLLSHYPTEPLQSLLTTTEKDRLEIWQRLIKHIDSAISRRQERDSGGGDGGGGE
ncbi:MAG: hypothetical protein KDJ52_27565 [Anaerolineae bacterium]|nr:hypothetical protein [Anaerolineae bacterium]